MKKIGIISPYFGGVLLNYFDLFLKSCEKNPTIDFLIFTDCYIQKEDKLNKNIKIYYYSFKEVQQKIQKFLILRLIYQDHIKYAIFIQHLG